MVEYEISVEQELDVPVGATSLRIVHEFGHEILEENVSGTYDWTPDSIGVHKLVWLDGETAVQTDFYSTYLPIVTKDDFIAKYPAWDSVTDEQFSLMEKVTRHIIQNYTGQKFGPYKDATIDVQGDGGDSLALPVKINTLVSVVDNYGADITQYVEIAPGTEMILQKSANFRGAYDYEVKRDMAWNKHQTFRDTHTFSVNGDFGYDYVPVEVELAMGILLNDAVGGDDVAQMRKVGVFEAKLGDFSLRLNADQWGTTGNVQADNLLASYMNMGVYFV
jgi:hypothetical protein